MSLPTDDKKGKAIYLMLKLSNVKTGQVAKILKEPPSTVSDRINGVLKGWQKQFGTVESIAAAAAAAAAGDGGANDTAAPTTSKTTKKRKAAGEGGKTQGSKKKAKAAAEVKEEEEDDDEV